MLLPTSANYNRNHTFVYSIMDRATEVLNLLGLFRSLGQ